MRADIRHRVSELRLWLDDADGYSKPYYLFLSVIWREPDVVEFVGLTEKVRREHWQALYEVCERFGIRQVVLKRFRNGAEYENRIPIGE